MNEIEARDHHHAGSVEATLEFLNTTELDGSGQWTETLPTLREAAGWLVGHGLLYPEEAGPLGRLDDTRQRDLLAHLHGARAAIREVMESLVAGRPAADSAVTAVNGLLRARTVVELAQADGTLVGHLADGPPSLVQHGQLRQPGQGSPSSSAHARSAAAGHLRRSLTGPDPWPDDQAGIRSQSTQRDPFHQRCHVAPSMPRVTTERRSGPHDAAAGTHDGSSDPPSDSHGCQLVPSQ